MAKKIRSFDEIIGHRNLVSYLQKCIDRDTVPQVIILHGNPGLGKSSIAKLLAIAVTTKYESDSLKQQYIKTVIEDNQSTDSIKLFNMSEIKEKEEEIQNVKAEMTVGFSKTGRKVLILDEVHGMSKAAQDAILTELEHLDENVYIFMCTTEIGVLRDSLISRSKATLPLHDLSSVESKRLICGLIQERRLTFDANVDMVVSLIADWAGNQPRKACNLIENFEVGSLVTSRDLEVFIDTNSASSVIELLKYLYGSLTLGIDYLDSMKYDESFANMLVEVCKVAFGHTSSSISAKDTMYIKDFMRDRDVKHILQFTAEVCGLSTIRRRRVISAFMRAHVMFAPNAVPQRSTEFKIQDISTLTQNVEDTSSLSINRGVERVKSLDEMFGDSEVLD